MNKKDEKGTNIWSEWLDFNLSNITAAVVVNKPGVFKVHANMKILYIGSGTNLQQSLKDSLSDPCISKARRFSFLVTDNAEQIKDQIVREYLDSHGGKLPSCMENN
ncbi:hypothetical protein YTPLAS21_12650 [Candidatus Nitrosocosmicus sp.]|jgi:hypothetical protein|nr:hypothetical protein YTPLAS21_12650 [Candidatus Nitrosocosmicus sp.]